jgi:hypothetical protein
VRFQVTNQNNTGAIWYQPEWGPWHLLASASSRLGIFLIQFAAIPVRATCAFAQNRAVRSELSGQ